jgi:hypothetical protein
MPWSGLQASVEATLCAAFGLALVACATVGRAFDTTRVPHVQEGQSKARIQGWFGPPANTMLLDRSDKGRVERWQWVHASATAAAAAKSQALVIDFDPSGHVCDHAYSEQ